MKPNTILKKKRPYCRAITKKGTRCEAKAQMGSPFCYFHMGHEAQLIRAGRVIAEPAAQQAQSANRRTEARARLAEKLDAVVEQSRLEHEARREAKAQENNTE